jgi:hypothetical protein
MITIQVDTKGVEAKIDKAKNSVNELMVKELNRWALGTTNDAKNLCPVDEGFLRNSISPVLAAPGKLNASVIVAANYAAYVEFGTRSFAASYVSSLPSNWQQYAASFRGKTGGSYQDFIVRLVGWMKRKGINPNAAYVIARKILRFGIRARPFLFPAVQKNIVELKNRLK